VEITEIMATIQHRYPLLLVDRLTIFEPGVRAEGIKNVTANEPWAAGHLPGDPQIPGVFILEHAAQIGCVLLLSLEENQGKLGIFTGMEQVAFRRPIRPGDQVRTEVVMVQRTRRSGKVHFISRVAGETHVEGYYTFLLVPDPTSR
jgi:3-hydroxyacyl-[acyl-carrier-protein] dehydratase